MYHVHAGVSGSQRKVWKSLDPGIKEIVCHLIWVLATALRVL